MVSMAKVGDLVPITKLVKADKPARVVVDPNAVVKVELDAMARRQGYADRHEMLVRVAEQMAREQREEQLRRIQCKQQILKERQQPQKGGAL
jgi:hypothetical protein